MKLRNKKTGEIRDFNAVIHELNMFGSLAELNNDWEDYEEPKAKMRDFYYINENGGVLRYVPSDPDGEDLSYMKYQKQIGNYFETEEQAEKAIDKLKAITRLKDKGFRFVGWRGDNDKHHLDGVAWYEMRLCGGYDIETANDLEMIFGPEEKE